MEKITYRHNIMNISSLDTFFSIRGGFNNNIRDVYFVRALGECEGYIEKIVEVDKRMGAEVSKGRLQYTRICNLGNMVDKEQIRKYSDVYDTWKSNGKIDLINIAQNESLNLTISEALVKAESMYRKSKPNVSQSITKNFLIKLLFWMDEEVGSFLDTWNEKKCIKIVIENVAKEQEYIFGYFLTLLGCDVLLLENRSDVNISDSLKMLSDTMTLGQFGNTILTPYVQYTQPVKETKQESFRMEKRSVKRENIKVVIPEHVRKEKTFEELAQMASSIVMIAVHDGNGDVKGTGSGIMIGRNGYILTNHHVVAGGSFYSVRIEDDNEIYHTDEVIKYNTTLDLAVIRIGRKLNPLSIYNGNQKLVRGQKVVAIGSPLGLFNSVSDGIISGFRNISENDMIQFTAPISPGSSGGAVLNMYGEVIGISTAGIDSGQNINLAVGYESILMFAKGFFG